MIEWGRESVVITGGKGFIGSHLVDRLAPVANHVTVMDNGIRGKNRCPGASMFASDLTKKVSSTVADSIVFHMAARVTNIHANMKDHLGMLQDNLRINTRVVETMRKHRPKMVVMCSTVCVYPHDAPVPTTEGSGWPLHPEETNEGYGLAKGILEKQGQFMCRELGIPVVVTRFSNAIGPRDYYDKASSHVVPALIRRVMEGESPLKVWGSGKQTRCFLDARDAAEALVKLAETPEAHDAIPINIGHDWEISMLDLARLVAKECGKPDLEITPDPTYPDGHARRAVSNARLKSLTGWAPAIPLEKTIHDMVEEYKAGRSNL